MHSNTPLLWNEYLCTELLSAECKIWPLIVTFKKNIKLDQFLVCVCQYCINEIPFSRLVFFLLLDRSCHHSSHPRLQLSSSLGVFSFQPAAWRLHQTVLCKNGSRDKGLGTLLRLDSGNPSKGFHICMQLKKTFQLQHMHLCCVRKQSCLGWHDCMTVTEKESSQCHEANFWQ